MLTRLTIKNYALIRHLEMEPSPALNVITGETGAGKSIMLGAVGLLLGNRADTKTLWNESEKCVTEGIFDISAYNLQELFESENLDYENLTVIRREISPAGKSRAFINDTPVTLDTLRKIGMTLMDVHSQHETLALGNRSFQLNLIDTFGAHVRIKDAYKAAWKTFVTAKNDYEKLVSESATLKQEADFINFQLNELVEANFSEDEQERLESSFRIMENAEDIKTRLNDALAQLQGSDLSVSHILASVRAGLNSINAYGPAYGVLSQRIESLRIELDDIIGEIEHEDSKIDFDPEKTNKVKDRLSLIYQLLQKHRSKTIGELLELQRSLQDKADRTTNLDADLVKAKAAFTLAGKNLETNASALTAARRKTTKPLAGQIETLLKDLGIPDARLSILMEPQTAGADGADDVDILFSANKGIEPRPLAQVASGGEFSRVMFSVKYVMAEKTALPTLILDEIDNGVSGEVAIQLAKMMKVMAKRHQIITISHLPQIAARGDYHYFVYKDNSSEKTVSNIQRLEGEARVTEIAKMIGGAKPSALNLENARELIKH